MWSPLRNKMKNKAEAIVSYDDNHCLVMVNMQRYDTTTAGGEMIPHIATLNHYWFLGVLFPKTG